MIVDLQVNLEKQDGTLVEPEQLVKSAVSAGLDGIVVTKGFELNPDISAYQEAGSPQGLAVFGGTRIATNHGLILVILPEGTQLEGDWAQKDGDLFDAQSVVDAVEELGGLTVALRPYDRDVAHPMGDHLFSLHGLGACEVLNAQVSEISNDLALEAASNMDMPCVGSSCAEGGEGLGLAATALRVKVNSCAELADTIRSGDCWPVSFSDTLPNIEPPRRDSRGRNNNGRRGPNNRNNRNNNNNRQHARGDGRDGRDGRGNNNQGPNKRRRRRSGGRVNGPVAENAGNRVDNARDNLPEDIGNRLRPGEESPFHNATNRMNGGEDN